jgi:uncharacterized membrane protein
MALFRAAAIAEDRGLTRRAKQLNQQRAATAGGGFDMEASGGDRKTYSSHRLVAFTDAVMAVAITLLVLDLKLPKGMTDAELPGVLAASSHQLWCYVLSFLVIGLLWMAHHNQFSFIARVDGALMWLNLLLLLMIGLIPFVTSVMSDHASALPTMLYAAVLMTTCLTLAAIWGYARRDPELMDAAVPAAERREGLVTPLLIALIFALSIPVAYLWGSAAGQWTWLLALPAGHVAAMLK